MSRSTRFVLAALIAVVAASGCARRPQLPPPNVGYEELRETFHGLDLTPLEGRRILLDPGHGGVFPGVVGRDGLSEADANLGVALYLRGLLEAAGSEVFMTRTTDRDFVSPADSSLAVDLAARVAMCDTLRPDVFLSLHHNSNAALDRDLNETQTYYPVGRDGPDLDLARAIHRHLVRNLGIRPAKILPGNFYVLRNAPEGVPAVLGEPSMLSHPGVEAKLVTAEKMELEAQAYFLGLVEFFAGGRPVWTASSANRNWRVSGPAWLFESSPGDPGLDPSSVRVLADGVPVPIEIDSDTRTVHWRPQHPLPHGPVIVEVHGRNLAGRAAPVFRDTLSGRTTIANIRVVSVEERSEDGTDLRRLLHWANVDERGAPAFAVGPLWLGDGIIDSDQNLLLTRHGGSSGTFLIAMDQSPPLRFIIQQRLEDMFQNYHVFPTLLSLPAGQRWVVLGDAEGSTSDADWSLRWHDGFPARHLDKLEIVDRSLPYAPMAESDRVWLERPGHLPLLRTPADAWTDTLAWQPLLPELAGRTIILDPAGGGPDDQGLCPMGTPGRELNLRVAERLADLLRGAGANPILTRTGPGWVPNEHKVLTTNEEGGALFLTIARNPDGPGTRLFHHHGSRNGTRWAGLTAAAFADAGGDTAAIAPSYAYLLRHTAPPALRCELPLPRTEDAEDLARSPSAQQAEALALFRAIAGYFTPAEDGGLPPGWDLASFMARHRTALPHPDDVDLVRVDGNWLWLPPAPGAPAAPLPATGTVRTLEVRSGDQWWVMEADLAADTVTTRLYGVGDRVVDPAADGPPEHEIPQRPEETDAP